MTISEDWQFEFNGLLMGGNTNSYNVVSVKGLTDTPAVVTSDVNRLRQHGMTAGDDYMKGRTIELEIELEAGNAAAFNTVVEDLTVATRPGQPESPLSFKIPGVAGGMRRYVNARPRKRSLPIDQDFYYRMPVATIQFDCTDPFIYNLEPVSQGVEWGRCGLQNALSGFGFPLVAPFVASSAIVGGGTIGVGGVTITPVGDAESIPSIVILGPCTNPSVYGPDGSTLRLSLTIPAGGYVTLDARDHTVEYAGGTNMYGSLDPTSRWFNIPVGGGIIWFTAEADWDANTSMTVTALSNWI